MNDEGRKPQRLAFVAFVLLFLLIVSLGLMQPSIRISGLSVQFTEIVFICLLPFAVTLAWRNRSSLKIDTAVYPIGSYFITLFAATVFSPTIDTSIGKFAGVCYLSLLALVVPLILRDRIALERIVATWIVVSTIVSSIGVFAAVLFIVFGSNPLSPIFLHGFGSLPVGNYPRIQSTFVYPAMLCNYLTVSVCLTIFAYLKGRLDRSFWPVIVVHILAAMLTLTPGLGGFIFALAIGACFIPKMHTDRRRTNIAVSIGIFAVIGSIALSAKAPWHISSAFYMNGATVETFNVGPRLLTWIGAFAAMLDKPIFGAGVGNAVTSVMFTTGLGQNRLLTDAHNSWLNIGAQAGLPGFIALVWVTVHFGRRALRAIRSANASLGFSAAFGVAFLSAFVAQGFVGSFEDARHLWVLMGLIVAAERLEQLEHG